MFKIGEFSKLKQVSIRMLRYYDEAGFRREGHVREGKMVDTFCDYYLYGIIKSDYLKSLI